MKDRSSGTVCPGRVLRDKSHGDCESGYFQTPEKVQLGWLKESLSRLLTPLNPKPLTNMLQQTPSLLPCVPRACLFCKNYGAI